MELHDGVFESLKYLFGTVLSAGLSYTLWRHKRNTTHMDALDKSVQDLVAGSKVIDVELRTIKEDISEIKRDLKKILFKL